MSTTIIVMPESDDVTLCLTLTGIITKDDHRRNLYNELDRRIKKFGTFNLLIFFSKDFQGWQEDAAGSSMGSIIEQAKYGRKIAYVNAPEKKVLQTKLSKPLFTGDVRFFNEADLLAATDWVKA